MSLRVDTQARIEAVRFQNQTGSPAAPDAGYSLIYILPTGLYMETSGGAVIGPFVTGTSQSKTLIQELTPTGTGVSFTSIPGTYKKLTLEFAARSTQAATTVHATVSFNADTTDGNYDRNLLLSYGASTVAGTGGSDRQLLQNSIMAANATAGEFSIGILEIPQYANTNFRKHVIALCSRNEGGTPKTINQTSMMRWANSAAITRVDIDLSAGNYAANSVFRLYGEI